MVKLGVKLLHFHVSIFSFLLNITTTYYCEAGVKKFFSFVSIAKSLDQLHPPGVTEQNPTEGLSKEPCGGQGRVATMVLCGYGPQVLT